MAKPAAAKVAWAFDPFSKPVSDFKPWVQFLDEIAKLEKSDIEPVYVLSPDGFNWSGEFSGPWVKKYRPLAEAAAEQVLAPFAKHPVGKVRILVNPKVSRRGDVAKFAQHMKREKKSLVVVQTHARQGLERWFLGSFAESLLLQSKVPVLSINPHTKPPTHIRRILFPTDLSQASRRTFKKLLMKCKSWGAELIVLHKLPDPIEPIVQSGVYMAGGGWISLSQYYAKESGERRRQLDTWLKEAQRQRVPATVEIIETPGLVADTILAAAEKLNADMVALSSHSGAIASVLVGSVARQVVRRAHCPVMVFHESPKAH